MVQGYPSLGSGSVSVRTFVHVGVGQAQNYADMTRDELIKLIIYQRECMEETEVSRKKEREDSAVRISALAAEVSELNKRVGELTEKLKAGSQNAFEMARLVSGLLEQLWEKDRKIAELQSEVKASCKNRFGHKSPKGTKGSDDENRLTPHTDVKDGFNGTSGLIRGTSGTPRKRRE